MTGNHLGVVGLICVGFGMGCSAALIPAGPRDHVQSVTADQAATAQFWPSIPMQVWPTLPATTEGLLIQPATVWGANPLWGKQLSVVGQSPARNSNTFVFAQNRQSPFALYFACSPGEQATLTQWNPGGTGSGVYDVRPASGGDARLHLPNAAHIVAVEVNAGRGSHDNYGPHFVATKTRRLDGTAAVPIALDVTFDHALARWHSFIDSQQPTIAAELERGNQALGGTPWGPETLSQREAFFPSWRVEAQELVVVYYRQVIRTSSKTTMSEGRGGCSKYDFRTPVVRMCPAPMPPHPVTVLRSYTVELGMELRYDKNGALLSHVNYSPRSLRN